MDLGLDLLTHNTEAKAVTVGVTVQLHLLTIILPAPSIATQVAHKCWDISWSTATACTNVTPQVHRTNMRPSLCAPQEHQSKSFLAARALLQHVLLQWQRGSSSQSSP